MLIIIGYLAGKHSIRRLRHWCQKKRDVLGKKLKLSGGIPSVSTISRIASKVDHELVALAFMDWIGQIVGTRGRDIIMDGKALRGATDKIGGKNTPYILNAIDAATNLVIAQLAIPEKTNEITAIPELIRMLDIRGSTVTIDAIGTATTILNLINEKGGYFIQQVKKNCPATYQEITDFFEEAEKEKAEDEEKFNDKYKEQYTECSASEVNRERHEHRTMKCYGMDEEIGKIREAVPCMRTIGMSIQVRIPIEKDENGNDVTPTKGEFIKNGSRKRPRITDGDGFTDDIERVGMISNKDCNADELAQYKRAHWKIENCLHYILDETFHEDKSTARKSRELLSVLRKTAYNIIRLIQMNEPGENVPFSHVMDDIADDFGLAARYIFLPIPSMY